MDSTRRISSYETRLWSSCCSFCSNRYFAIPKVSRFKIRPLTSDRFAVDRERDCGVVLEDQRPPVIQLRHWPRRRPRLGGHGLVVVWLPEAAKGSFPGRLIKGRERFLVTSKVLIGVNSVTRLWGLACSPHQRKVMNSNPDSNSGEETPKRIKATRTGPSL